MKPAFVDFQVFRAPVGNRREMIQIIAYPTESPHGYIAVVGNKELLLVVCRAHYGQRLGVECTVPAFTGHHGFSGNAAIPVHQAEGFAVQPIRLTLYLVIIPEFEFVVDVVGAIPSAEACTGCTSLHIPVPFAIVQHKGSVAVPRHRKGGPALLRRVRQTVVIPVINILLRYAVGGIAIHINLIICSGNLLKVVFRCSVSRRGTLGRLGFLNSNSAAIIVKLIAKVVPVFMADIQAFTSPADEFFDAGYLIPATGDCSRALDNSIGRKAVRLKRDGVPLTDRIEALGLFPISLVSKMHDRESGAGVLRIQQRHRHIHLGAGLYLLAIGVDDGNVKHACVFKAGSAHRRR